MFGDLQGEDGQLRLLQGGQQLSLQGDRQWISKEPGGVQGLHLDGGTQGHLQGDGQLRLQPGG